MPIFSGVLAYFPHAIAAVAQLSKVGNDQHNPGQPLHWAKEKSSDEPDALLRHMCDMAIDEEHRDPDKVLAAVKMAWRALANLERMHDRGINIFLPEEKVDHGGVRVGEVIKVKKPDHLGYVPVYDPKTKTIEHRHASTLKTYEPLPEKPF